jgi:isopentenyl phosphate kinase
MTPSPTTFLKLGGSLITDKSEPRTVRQDVLDGIASEIAEWLEGRTHPGLLIGHGSGSFGHFPASEHGTRTGVRTPDQWIGFAAVWAAAAELNHLVTTALQAAGIPAMSFPASAAAHAENGRIRTWDTGPIRAALAAGLVPVVYGDVAFDLAIGGTILSTEDLFTHLAAGFEPDRILIAGIEEGVWVDYPQRTDLIPVIDPSAPGSRWGSAGAADDPDVTGGMRGKVAAMIALVERMPRLKVRIFGGAEPGSIKAALAGAPLGTLINRI